MQNSDLFNKILQLFAALRDSIQRMLQKSLDSERRMEEESRRIAEAQRRIDAARAEARSRFAWVIVGAGVALGIGAIAATGLFIGARYFIGDRPITLTPMAVLAGAPPPAPLVPLPPPSNASVNPDDDAGADAGDNCGLELLEPVDGQEIAVDGPLAIEWSDAEGAASYLLELHPPDGTADAWLIETEDTFRQIYMSNFPAEGEYGLVVSAMDADGDPACSVEFTFYKEAYLFAEAGDASAGGQPGAVDASGAALPITPTWDPADGTVDYGGCPGCDGNDGDPIVK
jgi:hypothetical protein